MIENLLKRASVRSFKKEKLDDETISKLKQVVNASPTWKNYQDFSAIFITDQKTKDVLSECNLNDEMAKEIADGVMKAKALEKLYLGNNQMIKGLSNILYNLAFQPSIKVIDISGNASSHRIETSVALYKLLKMSQTIESLICSKILATVSLALVGFVAPVPSFENVSL